MRKLAATLFALAIHINTIGPHPIITAAECDAEGGVIVRGYDADGLLSAYCRIDTAIIGKVIG